MPDPIDPSERDDPALQDILDAAADLPAERRPAFLDVACGGDVGLRAEVRALLLSLDEAGGFLAEPPAAAAPGPDESPGARIGRYRLVEKVGEGGMGVVYVADQEHPVRRQVAVKVIKLGMDTRQVVARFEAERQALALMDHPNIARVLDAGATDAGRPYFVMELVRGVSITEYCDANRLTTRQRLELFVPVCRAVQHAHQKGVVHRDLKPSNVLVATHDGVAVPKVIDFGVAKATAGRLADATACTEFHQFVGTPAYMSPEQAAGGPDVDTRADVYGLGVLLYELLTGATPFDGEALRRLAYAEAQRVIREVEPPRPSASLATRGGGLAAVAARRGVEPGKLGRQLRGDLDWIVMRCLEKDPARRYETANALATDVRRHLGDEPVEASPPSAAYRLRKVARRHRKEAVAVAAVAAALLLGIVGTSAGMVRSRVLLGRAQAAEKRATDEKDEANRARAQAERQAGRANAVSDFMEGIFASARPIAYRSANDVRVVELLAGAADSVGPRLRDQPEAEAQVRATLGVTYLKLGNPGEARKHLERAYELACAAQGEESEQALRAASQLIAAMEGAPAEAESLARKCHRIALRKFGADDSRTRGLDAAVAASLGLAGKFAEAAAHYRGLVEKSRRMGRGVGDDADLYAQYAVALFKSGRFAEAEAIQRQVIELINAGAGAVDALDAVRCRKTYGEILVALGNREEAKKFFERVVRSQRDQLGPAHPETQDTMLRYADLLEAMGEDGAALQLHRELQDVDRALGRGEATPSLRRRAKLAVLLRRTGRPEQAERAVAEVLEQVRAHAPDDPGPSVELLDEILLGFGGMGPPDGWKCPALFTNLWSAMEEGFYTAADPGALEVWRVDGERLAFRLERWDPAGGATPGALATVAAGGLQELKGLAEPGPGIYRLVLEAARDGTRAAAWEAWLLFTDWEVDLYACGRKELDPAAYDTLLGGGRGVHCRVTNLALPHFQARQGPWPGAGETYYALAATAAVDLPRGAYRFSASSDDGVRLYVDGRLAIDSWVLRSADRDDAVVHLEGGRHELRVEYFQSHGGSMLRLQLAPAIGLTPTALPVRGSDGFARRRREAGARRLEAVLDDDVRRRPGEARPLFDRADFLAAQGRFKESAADFAGGLEADPSDHFLWFNGAAVTLRAGDVGGYRRLCVGMLERFGDSTARVVCQRVVRACTALPDAVADLAPLSAAADRAVAPGEVGGDSYARTWAALAQGMAGYRAGQFESAAQWLERAVPGMEPGGQACAYFFLAMAECKCGRGDGADAAFEKGEALCRGNPPQGGAFPGPYADWIIALQARAEAASTLGRPLTPAGVGE